MILNVCFTPLRLSCHLSIGTTWLNWASTPLCSSVWPRMSNAKWVNSFCEQRKSVQHLYFIYWSVHTTVGSSKDAKFVIGTYFRKQNTAWTVHSHHLISDNNTPATGCLDITLVLHARVSSVCKCVPASVCQGRLCSADWGWSTAGRILPRRHTVFPQRSITTFYLLSRLWTHAHAHAHTSTRACSSTVITLIRPA